MMWVLALDTSSPGGAVALLRDDEPAVERAGDSAFSHAERLPRAIADVLAEAELPPSALDLLAVASGPGAFTGLRVGLATVQGLALALDRPAVGVSALAAAAWRAFAGEPALTICGVWLDAARGEVFAAAFGRPAAPLPDWPLVELAAASVATPALTLHEWHGVVPQHAPLLLGPAARGRDEASAAGHPIVAAEAPLAVAVGRIGRLAHLAGQSGPPHALTPLYVRRPDAEVERDRRLGVDVSGR
jgi:tRNA threonylcarbamoyladenosine biosynthesis protein TsaB